MTRMTAEQRRRSSAEGRGGGCETLTSSPERRAWRYQRWHRDRPDDSDSSKDYGSFPGAVIDKGVNAPVILQIQVPAAKVFPTSVEVLQTQHIDRTLHFRCAQRLFQDIEEILQV